MDNIQGCDSYTVYLLRSSVGVFCQGLSYFFHRSSVQGILTAVIYFPILKHVLSLQVCETLIMEMPRGRVAMMPPTCCVSIACIL
jgi:hypothetical protein